VPFVIAEHIDAYLERLLAPEGLTPRDVKHWCIHPGGPKIIESSPRSSG
jgi:predicted naringenin-chalcone synthase